MRSGNRNLTLWLLACALACPASVVHAQSVQKPEPAEQPAKKDPNVSLKALDAGTKAYTAGKFEPAVQSLTAALANGGLPPPKMAQAYYYRGMAYKKQKKPAQALSDLTVAVWVNGGLGDSERAAAMDARNEVYREAGLGDQAPPIANAVGTPSPQQKAAAAPAAAPVAKPTPAAAPTPVVPVAAPATSAPAERPVWQAEANAAPPPPMPMPVAESAPAPTSPAASTSAAPVAVLSNQPDSAPSLTPVAGLAEQPAQPSSGGSDMMAPLASAGKSIANAGSSIGGFFSNMFGQESNAPVPSTTGSTAAAAAEPTYVPQGPVAQVSESEPQRAPGYEATVAPASSGKQVKLASVETSSTTPAPAVSGNGRYRLQLASVRSREEADRIAQTVMAVHADQLGGAEAHVDEAVIGDMGTFYRVRLGPYANANDPKKLCTTLKPQGFDCQVVTQ